MKKETRVLGICGGIGSGKSILSRLVALYGIPVFDTDSVAKAVYFDSGVAAQLEKLLGRSVLNEQGEIDRPFLSSIIFGTPSVKKIEMERIIHSAVEEKFLSWKAQSSYEWVGMESGILYSSRMNRFCDAVILVDAPEAVRTERVMLRNKMPKEEVERRIRTQSDEIETAKVLASYTIKNYSPHSVIEQWEEIFNLIITQ